MTQADESAGFSILRESGEIRLEKTLDYESARFFNLVVVATDGGQQPLSATTEVVVVVEVGQRRLGQRRLGQRGLGQWGLGEGKLGEDFLRVVLRICD